MSNHMSRDVKSVLSCTLLDSVSSSALRHPRAGFFLQLALWTPHLNLSSTFAPETGTESMLLQMLSADVYMSVVAQQKHRNHADHKAAAVTLPQPCATCITEGRKTTKVSQTTM